MGIESPTHLIFIAIVALIVLGPKRLPELARSLGHGIREFRQSLEDGANSPDPPAAPDPPATPQPTVTPQQTVTPAPSASSPTPAPAPPPAPADSTAPAVVQSPPAAAPGEQRPQN
jgi:TatA/E family protein of Tat protein translocase